MHGKRSPMQFNLGRLSPKLSYTTNNGYNFDFYDEIWKISRQIYINWASVSHIATNDLIHSYKMVIAQYAVEKSPGHTYSNWARFKHFLLWESKGLTRISAIDPQALANYRASLKKRDAWYVGVITGLIRSWSKLGYDGLGDGLLPLINSWKLPGNIKGEVT